jgi:hypothetical protein
MAELRKLDLSCIESGKEVSMSFEGREGEYLTIVGFVFHDC